MDEPWWPGWGEAPEVWPVLPPGAELTIVKWDPSGTEKARYPGTVIAAAPPWVAVRTTWTLPEVAMDGLRFVPGDTLHEFFSPAAPFNVFAIFAPDGSLRGWYANVTYPAHLELAPAKPTLIWQDLYLDLVALPDGTATVEDEDELAASGLALRDGALHAEILRVRDELCQRFATRAFPFHETALICHGA